MSSSSLAEYPGLVSGETPNVDDWRIDRVLQALDETVDELSVRWNVEREEVVSDRNPVRIDIVGLGAKVTNNRIKLSNPDKYVRAMKMKGDSERLHAKVEESYPVPFHEVMEETGQLIGRRVENGWQHKGNIIDRSRDELHGMMAIHEFCPWFLDQYEEWERTYIEEAKDMYEKSQVGIASTLINYINTEIEAKENLDDLPVDEIIDSLSEEDKMYEEILEPYAEKVLEDYLSGEEKYIDPEEIERDRIIELDEKLKSPFCHLSGIDTAKAVYKGELDGGPEDVIESDSEELEDELEYNELSVEEM